jgi:hypothetical protein
LRHLLPPAVRERVVAEADLNIVGDEPAAIAETVEPFIEQAWQSRTDALAWIASERAGSGGAATLGPEETFGALVEGRVDHLLIDPDHDFSSAIGTVASAIRRTERPARRARRRNRDRLIRAGHIGVDRGVGGAPRGRRHRRAAALLNRLAWLLRPPRAR